MAISTKSRFVSIDEDEDDKNICLLESNPANTERIFRCRHCSPIDNTYQLICTLKQIGDPDTKVICEEDCEHCPGFQSRYIQYPIFRQSQRFPGAFKIPFEGCDLCLQLSVT